MRTWVALMVLCSDKEGIQFFLKLSCFSCKIRVLPNKINPLRIPHSRKILWLRKIHITTIPTFRPYWTRESSGGDRLLPMFRPYGATHVSSLRLPTFRPYGTRVASGVFRYPPPVPAVATHISSLAGLGLHLEDVRLFLVQRRVQWTMIILWAIWLSFLVLSPTDSSTAGVP